MSAYFEAKQKVIKELKVALGKGYTPNVSELEIPPDQVMGDLAYPCFNLAKGLKKNPGELAVELAAKIEPQGWIKKAEAKGPYVNFFLKPEVFGQAVLEEINKEGKDYGKSTIGHQRRVMVEYANLNTHKEVHIGHLRNCFVGHTVINVLRAAGYEVVPTAYINDLGTHVAKCVWGLEKFHSGEEPPKDERITFLGRVYTEATRAEETDPKAREEISKVYHELENGRGASVTTWRKTRKWSLDDLKRIFKELGLPIDVWYFESEFIKEAKKTIDYLIKKGLVIHSNGAWIIDFTSENLGVYILVKSDGTLLYYAKDIPLAFKKEAEYHPEKSIYVVDNRQSLAMQQLFATLKKMDFKRELVHLAYDFVTLKEGAMSSRKGNIIRYETLRDTLLEAVEEETKKRHPNWKENKIKKTAWAIAFAAIRFGILRQDPNKKIIFDMEEVVSFEGYTGPYLLYTFARIQSVLKKAGKIKPEIKIEKLILPIEHQILFQLARYPEIVVNTAQDFKLDRLAEYLFVLAKTFASFYHEAQVVRVENKDLTAARLALVHAVGQTIQNGLAMMGIETIKEM